METKPQTLPPSAGIVEYTEWVNESGLDAPWSRPGPLIAQKQTRVEPYLWRWSDIEPRLTRSADYMAPGEGGERRILRLANPGVPEKTTAHTLSLAVQFLLPGETAPPHRHTPNALRFMLEGDGAYTIVEGEKCEMSRGDLVLTPHMTIHTHGNEGTGSVMWLDVLDSPVVRYLEALQMETEEELDGAGPNPSGPLRQIHFKWADAYAELERRAEAGDVDPYDDVVFEYRDPETGAPIMPTISCFLQMIRPGVTTESHTQNSTATYHVVSGSGSTLVDGQTFEWSPGDFFVVPPNAAHRHSNPNDEPAILFSTHDKALLLALGLYREAPADGS